MDRVYWERVHMDQRIQEWRQERIRKMASRLQLHSDKERTISPNVLGCTNYGQPLHLHPGQQRSHSQDRSRYGERWHPSYNNYNVNSNYDYSGGYNHHQQYNQGDRRAEYRTDHRGHNSYNQKGRQKVHFSSQKSLYNERRQNVRFSRKYSSCSKIDNAVDAGTENVVLPDPDICKNVTDSNPTIAEDKSLSNSEMDNIIRSVIKNVNSVSETTDRNVNDDNTNKSNSEVSDNTLYVENTDYELGETTEECSESHPAQSTSSAVNIAESCENNELEPLQLDEISITEKTEHKDVTSLNTPLEPFINEDVCEISTLELLIETDDSIIIHSDSENITNTSSNAVEEEEAINTYSNESDEDKEVSQSSEGAVHTQFEERNFGEYGQNRTDDETMNTFSNDCDEVKEMAQSSEVTANTYRFERQWDREEHGQNRTDDETMNTYSNECDEVKQLAQSPQVAVNACPFEVQCDLEEQDQDQMAMTDNADMPNIQDTDPLAIVVSEYCEEETRIEDAGTEAVVVEEDTKLAEDITKEIESMEHKMAHININKNKEDEDLIECKTPMKRERKKVLLDATNILPSSTIKYSMREVRKNDESEIIVTPVRRSLRISSVTPQSRQKNMCVENLEELSADVKQKIKFVANPSIDM